MRTIALTALLLFAASTAAQAQRYSMPDPRKGEYEWSFAVVAQDSESAGSGGGSTVDVDDAIGLGFGFGYFVADRLSVGADFEWLSPDYRARLVDETGAVTTFDHELTQLNFRFKGSYYFLDGPFTPYVELGLGWTYVDSNVADGPPLVGCWWHPWFGYICDGFYNTFDETSFTYGSALGLSYRMRGGTTLKLSYNTYGLDGGSNTPEPTLNAFRLEAAWSF